MCVDATRGVLLHCCIPVTVYPLPVLVNKLRTKCSKVTNVAMMPWWQFTCREEIAWDDVLLGATTTTTTGPPPVDSGGGLHVMMMGRIIIL